MSCKICKRQACTESFHSIQDQEDFENKTGKYAPEPEENLEPIDSDTFHDDRGDNE